MQKTKQRDQFQTSFDFLKKLFLGKRQWLRAQFQYILVDSTLYTIKPNGIKPQTVDSKISSVLIF